MESFSSSPGPERTEQKKGKYWYRQTENYCPQCNRSEVIRERVYGERPTDWYARHIHIERYDYCD